MIAWCLDDQHLFGHILKISAKMDGALQCKDTLIFGFDTEMAERCLI